jgi:hypothetical protein
MQAPGFSPARPFLAQMSFALFSDCCGAISRQQKHSGFGVSLILNRFKTKGPEL